MDETRGGGVTQEQGRLLRLGTKSPRSGESCENLGRLVLCIVCCSLRFPSLPDVLEVVHLPPLVLHARPSAPRLLGGVNDLLAIDRPSTGVVEYQTRLD